MHTKNQPKPKDHVMDESVCALPDDRPYEERTREEQMDSEARQMIACMNRNRWE